MVSFVTGGMAGFELADYAQCAIDEAIGGYVADFAAGIDLADLDETMAAVEEVVSLPEYRGTYFLGHPHTAKHARRRLYQPGVFTVGSLTRTLAAGEKTVLQKAEARVESLLRDRSPLASPDLRRELLRLATRP